jgi:hypothetical protein
MSTKEETFFFLSLMYCAQGFVIIHLSVTELLPDAWTDWNQTWHNNSEWSGDGLHRICSDIFKSIINISI